MFKGLKPDKKRFVGIRFHETAARPHGKYVLSGLAYSPVPKNPVENLAHRYGSAKSALRDCVGRIQDATGIVLYSASGPLRDFNPGKVCNELLLAHPTLPDLYNAWHKAGVAFESAGIDEHVARQYMSELESHLKGVAKAEGLLVDAQKVMDIQTFCSNAKSRNMPLGNELAKFLERYMARYDFNFPMSMETDLMKLVRKSKIGVKQKNDYLKQIQHIFGQNVDQRKLVIANFCVYSPAKEVLQPVFEKHLAANNGHILPSLKEELKEAYLKQHTEEHKEYKSAEVRKLYIEEVKKHGKSAVKRLGSYKEFSAQSGKTEHTLHGIDVLFSKKPSAEITKG